MTKIFFSDNVEWRSKNLSKVIYLDVKANVKQQEINCLVAVSYVVLQDSQNLKYNVKTDMPFFIWYKMIYYDRIDVSEGIDVNKTSASKECDVFH